MAEEEKEDIALKTLLSVSQRVAPEIPRDLVERVFALQRAHQFDRDRAVSHQELQKLVEEYAQSLEEGAR